MTEVVFVRHAATAWSGRRYCGRSDPWLSSQGRAEAAALAGELAATIPEPARIVSSPRRRARQTARAIAAAVGVTRLTVDPRWAETDFGRMEGKTFEDIERLEPRLAVRLAAGEIPIDWPGGETADALAERVDAALADLERTVAGDGSRAAPGTLIVVTHAGPLRLAIARLEGRDPRTIALVATGSIQRVSLPGQRARLRA